MVAWGSEETDNMDTDDPDFYFEGFVMHPADCDCQQRFKQAIQDNDKEDWSEESDKEAATHTWFNPSTPDPHLATWSTTEHDIAEFLHSPLLVLTLCVVVINVLRWEFGNVGKLQQLSGDKSLLLLIFPH